MNFLYPGFLFSLLAVAIPILIHLFNFRKFKKIYFSNVQFLKAAQEAQASRSRIKDVLVLICRMLAIIFLVLAFAQPYFSSVHSASNTAGKIINIYIDNSYSMAAVNKEGNLLDEAKRRAKEIIDGFEINDRFRLTTNEFEGKHQRLLSADEMRSQINEIQISAAQRNMQQVFNRLKQSDPNYTPTYSYILSDFQKVFTGKAALKAPDGQHIILIRIQSSTIPNIAIDSIWSLSPAHRPADQEKFVLQLHNYGAADGKDIPMQLLINNQQKAVARLNIPSGKSIRDTLQFSGLSAGWQKGMVRIKDYPIVFDDELKFSFKVNEGLNILQISGDPEERYISNLFAGDRYFHFSRMAESSIHYSGFSAYQLIVLSGLKNPSSGLAQQIKTYVENGGSVVFFPDLDNSLPTISAFLQNLSLPAVISMGRDTLNVTQIELKNSLFSNVFEKIPAQLDLPRVNRRFNYANTNFSSREDIMQFPMGQAFFSSYQLGAGKMYLAATSLNIKDSNLPKHHIFVPLLYKIAFSSVSQIPLYQRLGANNLTLATPLRLNPAQSLRLKSPQTEIIPELRQLPGKTSLYIADQLKEAGFYELMKGNELLGIYAFNDTKEESDMHYTADKEIQQVFKSKNLILANPSARLSLAAVENNHTELWKLCIVLCAVFLITEVLLIRFFNKLKL